MKKPRKKKQKDQDQAVPAPSREAGQQAPVSPAAPASSPSTRTPRTAQPSTRIEFDADLPDSAEPRVSRLALPMMVIPLLGLLVYVADMYLMDHGGQFNALVYYPNEEVPRPIGSGPDGQYIFETRAGCAACHGANGAGVASTGSPPLAGSDWVLVEGPNRMIRIVLNGAVGPFEVNGKPYNGNMVAWRDILTDDEIAAVLTYIRQAWGNDAGLVEPEQVKAIRDETADRTPPWTAEELLRIPVSD